MCFIAAGYFTRGKVRRRWVQLVHKFQWTIRRRLPGKVWLTRNQVILVFCFWLEKAYVGVFTVTHGFVLWVICRKTDSNDMQDLVQMMTQTLRMDIGNGAVEVDKGRLGSSALPEFKLNRRYRDTLVLHGKARREAEDLSLGEMPIGWTLCHHIFYLLLL